MASSHCVLVIVVLVTEI